MQFLIFEYSFQGKYVYNIYVCMQYMHPKSLQMLDLVIIYIQVIKLFYSVLYVLK